MRISSCDAAFVPDIPEEKELFDLELEIKESEGAEFGATFTCSTVGCTTRCPTARNCRSLFDLELEIKQNIPESSELKSTGMCKTTTAACSRHRC